MSYRRVSEDDEVDGIGCVFLIDSIITAAPSTNGPSADTVIAHAIVNTFAFDDDKDDEIPLCDIYTLRVHKI